eukprot:TRINITY_DN4552_c0_g1_i7.p2 TRINITY_DN4552_c0_g1~~TRINITY_DN4552_c0_g1_i7.p2  ORF type:complete len:110 (-),score=3.16 TRINITY_DN4552_c0_g1_i7:147-476(-)
MKISVSMQCQTARLIPRKQKYSEEQYNCEQIALFFFQIQIEVVSLMHYCQTQNLLQMKRSVLSLLAFLILVGVKAHTTVSRDKDYAAYLFVYFTGNPMYSALILSLIHI